MKLKDIVWEGYNRAECDYCTESRGSLRACLRKSFWLMKSSLQVDPLDRYLPRHLREVGLWLIAQLRHSS